MPPYPNPVRTSIRFATNDRFQFAEIRGLIASVTATPVSGSPGGESKTNLEFGSGSTRSGQPSMGLADPTRDWLIDGWRVRWYRSQIKPVGRSARACNGSGGPFRDAGWLTRESATFREILEWTRNKFDTRGKDSVVLGSMSEEIWISRL